MNFYKEKDTDKVVFLDKALDNYELLKANVEDASLEKHVPVYKVENNKIYVKIGDILHPMTEKHHIVWIALVKDNNMEMKELNHLDNPEVVFNYVSGSTIYTYCNLHGLWKTEVE